MLSNFRIPLRNIILVRGSTKQRKKEKKKDILIDYYLKLSIFFH